MAGRIAGITVEIGGNTTKLQSALKGVDQQLRNMKSGLRDVDRMLKFNPTSTTLLTQKQQLLKKSIEDTKGRLQQLKEAQKQMDAKGVDKNSEDYQRLQREIQATERNLKQLEKEYEKFASVTGAKMQAVGAKMKEVGAKISEAGQNITTHLTAPIVAFAGLAVKAFQDVDKGMDAVVKKTGATGEALDSMKDSVKTLATSIPTDFETAGNAVGEVATRFGLTGDALEDLSGKFLKFAQLNGTDVSTSVDEVQKALSAFGLSSDEASGYLDRLNKVGQDTGVKVDKLAQGIVTNGAAFQEMGLSIDQSTVFMGQLEKSGANSETVLNGMRKALKNAAKEGKPLNQALSELQDEIVHGKDGMDGLQAAYELFGKSGDQIYSAVKNGTVNFKELGITVENVSGNIETTFENTLDPVDKFKMAVNQARVAGADLGNAILTRLTPFIEKLQMSLQSLGDKFKSLSTDQQDMILKIGLIAAAVGPVLLVVGKLVSGIGSLISSMGTLMSTVKAVAVGGATLASTFGVIVGGAVALVGAMWALSKAHDAVLEKTYGFTDAEKKQFQALEEVTNKYNEAAKARNDSVADVQVEYERIEGLRKQYNGLIDSNGNVKKGYEDRAAFIKSELAQALGIEESELDKLIDKNGKLKGKVEELIQVKKAEAILDANKDIYTQALKDRQQAAEKLGPALDSLQQKRAEQAEAEANYQKAMEEYNSQDPRFRVWTDEMAKAKDAFETTSAAVEEQEKVVNGYTDTLEKTGQEIENYEGLTKAVADKDTKAMKAWERVYTQGLKTRSNAQHDELVQQATQAQTDYQSIKRAYDKGEDGVTKSMVKLAKQRRDAANKEAGITTEDAEENAKKTAKAQTKGYKEGSKGVDKELSKTRKAVSDNLGKAATEAGKKGQTMKAKLLEATSKMASGADSSFGKVGKSANDKMEKASKTVSKKASVIKSIFPINVGNIMTGSMNIPKLIVDHFDKIAGASIPVLKGVKEFFGFAKGYENPMLFTSPALYGGAVFGDRGNHAGGEMVYGRENLMRDIQQAVGVGRNIYITVNESNNPRQTAQYIAQELEIATRAIS